MTQTLQYEIQCLLTKRLVTNMGTYLQILSQELPIFTKYLSSVTEVQKNTKTEVQKNAKTFIQFINFDKE